MTTAADLGRRFLQALTTRDVDQVMPLWSIDGVLDFPFAPDGSPKTFEGAATIRRTLDSAFRQRVRMAFPTIVAHQGADPNLAFIEFNGEMTLASGTPYNNRYIAKVEARAGKLTLFREYFNPLVDLAAGNPRAAENE